jgi:hypothetical protein
MILVTCEKCSLCIRIMGSAQEIDYLVGEHSDFWPDKFPCPQCEKPALGIFELEMNPNALGLFRVVDLNPQEAFAAFNGFGLPHELFCSAASLNSLLREQPIKRVAARDIPGTTRCRVDFFELWDGTLVYFGAGGEGAVVYRIVRPASYVEKVNAR